MPYYDNNRDYYGNSRRSDRGNYNRSYNDNRGGNYDDRDRRSMNDCPFSINQPVKHIATGVKLSVIRIGREQIECRKPDLSSEWFYEYELEPIAEGNN